MREEDRETGNNTNHLPQPSRCDDVSGVDKTVQETSRGFDGFANVVFEVFLSCSRAGNQRKSSQVSSSRLRFFLAVRWQASASRGARVAGTKASSSRALKPSSSSPLPSFLLQFKLRPFQHLSLLPSHPSFPSNKINAGCHSPKLSVINSNALGYSWTTSELSPVRLNRSRM